MSQSLRAMRRIEGRGKGLVSSCKSSRAFGSRNKAVVESSWVAENTLWIRERQGLGIVCDIENRSIVYFLCIYFGIAGFVVVSGILWHV
jgi:hypothetical protein